MGSFLASFWAIAYLHEHILESAGICGTSVDRMALSFGAVACQHCIGDDTQLEGHMRKRTPVYWIATPVSINMKRRKCFACRDAKNLLLSCTPTFHVDRCQTLSRSPLGPKASCQAWPIRVSILPLRTNFVVQVLISVKSPHRLQLAGRTLAVSPRCLRLTGWLFSRVMSSSATDPLLLLRSTLLSPSPPVLSTSDDPTAAESSQTHSLVTATHIYFPLSPSSISPVPICVPLTTATRFQSQTPEPPTLVDLRSIYFTWQQKDETVPVYISRAAELDKELPEGQKLRNLVFAERIELIAWLEGASDEEGGSEFITPLATDDVGAGHGAAKAADVASGAAGAGGPAVVGGTGAATSAGGRSVKVVDARLQEIYNSERKMGDRNTVLRGIKPTVSRVDWLTP